MAENTDVKEDEIEKGSSLNETSESSGKKEEKTEPASESGKGSSKKGKDLKAEKEIRKLQSEIEGYAGKLVEARKEFDELKDQYLRKQADFENFRKRMLREKEDSIKFANTTLLNDIIAVIDDFERALQSSEESKDFDALHSGIELIEKQMISMLETNWGLKRFDSAGQPFDPEKHEALMMEESSEYDTQTVVEDFMKGYLLHDRVIRHAKVKVANPAPESKSESAAE